MATKTKEITSRRGAMLESVIYRNLRWHYKNESTTRENTKKATARMKHAPKKKWSEASMKYARVEGREASLPVMSPGLHSLFYLRIQRSNKIPEEARSLLARILLSIHKEISGRSAGM